MSGSEIRQNVYAVVRSAAGSSNRQEAIDNVINNMNEDGNGLKPENVILESCEGIEFEVPAALVEQSRVVKNGLSNGFLNYVPLPGITKPVVELMISFWTEHLGSDKFTEEREDEVRDWEKNFFLKLSREMLFSLVHAANYLDAKEMLDSTCQYIVDSIKDMSVEEVRDYFRIVNNFSPEEEKQMSEENRRASEPLD